MEKVPRTPPKLLYNKTNKCSETFETGFAALVFVFAIRIFGKGVGNPFCKRGFP